MTTKILLTYAWVRSTYAALRNLSQHKLTCYIADSIPMGMCRLSRYKKKFFTYHDPLVNEQQFVRDINTICMRNNIEIIFPLHDETTLLAKHRHLLDPSINLPIASFEQLTIANDKEQTRKKAEQCKIPIAHTYHYASLPELKTELCASTNSNTFVVRLRRGNSAKGVFYCNSAAETIQTVKNLIEKYKLTSNRYPVIQDYVFGEGWGVSSLYWEGKPVATFTHRRLREKTISGGDKHTKGTPT